MIGRCKLYQYLPILQKKEIPTLSFGDAQISTVARDYYQDHHFSGGRDGTISLWNVYNLFTGANKSSYIDSFLSRSVNATELIQELAHNVENRTTSWFLN